MLDLFSDGGPFQYVITLFGLAGIALSILQIIRKAEVDYLALIAGMIGATLFTAVCAYGFGMYQAGRALAQQPGDVTALAVKAEGIANTVLAWGGLLCGFNSVIGAIAWHTHRQSRTR
jgi:drug/metabolite transporter (DMT)-like permease